MLVLMREVGERLMVGDNIVITVLELRGDKVRIGIEAPKEVEVDREEVRVAKLTGQPVKREGPEEAAVLRAQAGRAEERRRCLHSRRGTM